MERFAVCGMSGPSGSEHRVQALVFLSVGSSPGRGHLLHKIGEVSAFCSTGQASD